MSRTSGGRLVEEASIGREGFVGFPLIMGGKTAINNTVVQVSGYASWLAISDLDEAMGLYECIRKIMLSYAQSLIIQLMQSIACVSLHSAEQRISRLLLHAHDRVTGTQFHVTQETLADALGLRRATVSEICNELARRRIISYSRGSLTIVDRQGLELCACDCYRHIHAASFLARTDADNQF
ncbi:Crp/Fnr family transcriptional regulator [Sphingomonas sp. LaA6.9]|uniref:Crp/Fnr family transcriptional regulator n=1 Tax=Sphingomonas sp. LaA6.9 TaxID=2919914 RepID=UPI001F4FC2FD|nr:Crp/Fnr family transcriptional regulator [Sphingomonas sp. LaA6.9]MCJ8158300.1 Crp/Fnr family transcriptional regulator [Sphingomonas sp. LaA6.9]